MAKIKVAVIGACGRMGREVVKAVLKEADLELVGAVDQFNSGKDIATVIGSEAIGVIIRSDLAESLRLDQPEVVVDFTTPATVMGNLRVVLQAGVNAVIGTTGLSKLNLEEITALCGQYHANTLVAPNFAIGALLMMRFAVLAGQYFPQVEIIELHHDQKLDAPSGTAIKTAEMILAGREATDGVKVGEEKIQGVRGGELGGIHLHSIRLPGLIAHQEVIFGGEGQTLTIRHDSLSRESFMPGVVTAIRKIGEYPGLTYGLDKILF